MEKQNAKRKLKESSGFSDLIKMQTEFALIESMLKSKTLTIMATVGTLLFSAFLFFLFKMAGA